MFRKLPLILTMAFAAAVTLSCEKIPSENVVPSPEEPGESDDPAVEIFIPEDAISDSTSLSKLWKDQFACPGSIESVKDVQWVRWLADGKVESEFSAAKKNPSTDLRYEFKGEGCVRFVSEGDGYALTLPDCLSLVPDYTIPKYAQRFVSDSVSLRVTAEQVKPYTPNEYYYGIYTGEWLTRYIANPTYISQNKFRKLLPVVTDDTSIIEGYSTTVYSIVASGLDMPYYRIALVRPLGQWSRFGLLLYKSKSLEQASMFDDILKSFRMISRYGISKNFLPQQEARMNPAWNAETKAYYQKLLDQQTFDFGVFSVSMPADGAGDYDYQHERLIAEKSRLEEAFGCNYDIIPTYTPLSWYSNKIHFPVSFAREFAGGNGFNGKPVLQFTYQYTDNNNYVSPSNTSSVSTPVFDIVKGRYDDYFRTLAADIKEYGHPVLFRLNNEMNSDWTSYCGMMSLTDPEIFIAGWRRLYDIFTECGVDNCIWIFNPIATSCPYSNWGENLAYYPGNDYVQILGVTDYEMGNYLPFSSFRNRYSQVYDTNKEVFANLPWIISEFACGCGGLTTGVEKRNASAQAQWVRDMFSEFDNYAANEYLHPLKGGVWFSTNDVDWEEKTVNFLYLDPSLTETLAAIRDGLARMHSQK